MLDRGEKMSKTVGNVRDPDETAETFGVDGVRYMVLREVPFDRDADVSTEAFVRRYNADLANDLGNLVNRAVSMSGRYLDGRLPSVTDATRPPTRSCARRPSGSWPRTTRPWAGTTSTRRWRR